MLASNPPACSCLSSDRCETVLLALEADRGSLKLVFRHPSLRRPPMKVFSLQAPIYRGAFLSSRLTAQTSQLAAVRRDALERWRRARSRGLSAEEAARAIGGEPGLALPLGEAARAALAKAAPAASADLDQRSHAQDLDG